MKTQDTIRLFKTPKTDSFLVDMMKIHYSKPKGFVGRSICYSINFNNVYYGHIIGGSSTLHLAGRDEFFNLTKENKKENLRKIVNNIFYHIEKRRGKYPLRNLTSKVLKTFCNTIAKDWEAKYGYELIGFESLVELPRAGDLYLKDKWIEVGKTKGQTCKRTKGNGSDSWSGRRVWDTKNLKPKRVFCKHIKEI